MTWRERWARWRLWLGFGPEDPVRQMIEQTPHYRPWHWNDPDPVSGLDLSTPMFETIKQYGVRADELTSARTERVISCVRPPEEPYDWERDGL